MDFQTERPLSCFRFDVVQYHKIIQLSSATSPPPPPQYFHSNFCKIWPLESTCLFLMTLNLIPYIGDWLKSNQCRCYCQLYHSIIRPLHNYNANVRIYGSFPRLFSLFSAFVLQFSFCYFLNPNKQKHPLLSDRKRNKYC